MTLDSFHNFSPAKNRLRFGPNSLPCTKKCKNSFKYLFNDFEVLKWSKFLNELIPFFEAIFFLKLSIVISVMNEMIINSNKAMII